MTTATIKPRYFRTSGEFRKWLEKNHNKVDELWLGIYKKGSGETGVTLPEAQDVAMCFGWVDSIRRVDEESYMLRFTPRRFGASGPPATWSGLRSFEPRRMHEAGIRALERRLG